MQTCSTVFVLSKGDQSKITKLTDSEIETTTITTHPDEAGPSSTQSSKNYLKDYTRLGLS